MTNIIARRLYIYPVKSMAGIAITKLEFGKFGPLYDRNWMVINENGKAITQREQKSLALFKLNLAADYLEFNFKGDQFRLNHQLDEVNKITAQVWQFSDSLVDCGNLVAQYLSSHLQTNCRLVKIDSLFSRVSSGEIIRPISLVDSRQILVTSKESLKWLNQLLAKEGLANIKMDRFRPNIVLSGGENIFYENKWQNLRLGNLDLHREKACGRCLIITIDQATASPTGNSPLKILAKFNRDDNNKAAAFGTYFNVLNKNGVIQQNDICQNIIPR